MTKTMPAGTYFTIVGGMRADKGGLTSAMKERTRLVNFRLAEDGRHMPILTFSAPGSKTEDNVESHGLQDGEDVWNSYRHGLGDNHVGWLADLAAGASATKPVFFIVDGYKVGVPVMVDFKNRHIPHVHFILVAHNPTDGDSYTTFRKHAHLADALVCATRRQAGFLRTDPRHGGLVRNSNVYDIAFPRRELDLETQARDDRSIVMLTRINKQKDLPLAVSAFAELIRLARRGRLPRADQLKLDIFGLVENREQERKVLNLIDQYDLRARVKMQGYNPTATEKLTSSSLMWLTSRFEGWGLAITEAQQLGCVPVAVDCMFGPREQIEHGVDGFLVPVSDTHWVWNPHRLRAEGRRRPYLSNRPDPQQIAKQTLKVLEMDPAKLDGVREAAMHKFADGSRSLDTYIDSWVRVIEDVAR